MGAYEGPAVLATYSVDELVEEAALCESTYGPVLSDQELKGKIEEVEDALEAVKSIRTS